MRTVRYTDKNGSRLLPKKVVDSWDNYTDALGNITLSPKWVKPESWEMQDNQAAAADLM